MALQKILQLVKKYHPLADTQIIQSSYDFLLNELKNSPPETRNKTLQQSLDAGLHAALNKTGVEFISAGLFFNLNKKLFLFSLIGQR